MSKETFMKNSWETKDACEIIRESLREFKEKVALASSFSVEDNIILDIMVKEGEKLGIKPKAFTLDTGRLPEETYKVIEKLISKYQIEVNYYFPDYKEVEEMERKYGPNLFYKSLELRKICCKIRKIKPLKRALSNFDAWICGLRREQSVTRVELRKVEIDKVHNSMVKINPLADWTEEDVWKYVRENNVPYNELHDKGYPSIGCAPCTRAIKKTEHFRDGRWWWESPESRECGLHIKF